MRAKPFCEKHQCDKVKYITARKKSDGTVKNGGIGRVRHTNRGRR